MISTTTETNKRFYRWGLGDRVNLSKLRFFGLHSSSFPGSSGRKSPSYIEDDPVSTEHEDRTSGFIPRSLLTLPCHLDVRGWCRPFCLLRSAGNINDNKRTKGSSDTKECANGHSNHRVEASERLVMTNLPPSWVYASLLTPPTRHHCT